MAFKLLQPNLAMNKVKSLVQYLLIIVLMQCFYVAAHGTKHPTRYIATDGVDSGDCSNVQKPCASIAYAVELSSKGDKIFVSKGEYLSNGMNAFYLLSGLVDIEAGYSKSDQFSKQNIQGH